MGSVRQADKFDNSKIGTNFGLFGMTACISNAVHPPESKFLIVLYYFIPISILTVFGFYMLIFT